MKRLSPQFIFLESTSKHKIHNLEHHSIHLGSTFLISSFEEAALLSIDGMGDRLRKRKIFAPFVILVYCLILKGGILDGWQGWYYAFQRTLAELLLAIHLIENEHLR